MGLAGKIKSVVSCGISLHDLGINNQALNKDQALQAIDKFEELGVAVLGGDVYVMVDNIPESNNDN